ncbi:hypothetical protein PAQ31011_01547 [Pandoraea aquatica]|uniref:Uncharacterized protein n=1 Tax=Pandoraea aquatica TaxID=2508290 RepID=A0A5E4TTT4_9BURK|nr:hypothetical protein PAQ31011_01547 [Pandoraea aquatica]
MGMACPMPSWPDAMGAGEGAIGMACPIASCPVLAGGLVTCPLWLVMA